MEFQRVGHPEQVSVESMYDTKDQQKEGKCLGWLFQGNLCHQMLTQIPNQQ
jgi:hypothetical protein